jgi:hypothetical protein
LSVASIPLSAAPAPAAAPAAAPAHDVAFWRGIKTHDFAVPEGAAPGALLGEICGDLLGSPDPELRDQLGYEIADAWILRKRTVSDADLRPVLARLEQNLGEGIGENGTDSVLRRSFSALVLSLVAARDNDTPFLTAEEFDGTAVGRAGLLHARARRARLRPRQGLAPLGGAHRRPSESARPQPEAGPGRAAAHPRRCRPEDERVADVLDLGGGRSPGSRARSNRERVLPAAGERDREDRPGSISDVCHHAPSPGNRRERALNPLRSFRGLAYGARQSGFPLCLE